MTAQRSLATGGVRAKDRRAVVDKVAAAVMLQAWLDGRPRTEDMTDLPGDDDLTTGSDGPSGGAPRPAHPPGPDRVRNLWPSSSWSGSVPGLWLLRQVNPSGGPGEKVAVDIVPGTSVSAVATKLEDEGVITSAGIFRLYLKVAGGAGAIQAGEYELRENLSMGEAKAALRRGPSIKFQKLTIPEGWTLEQIAGRVGELPGRSRDKFLTAARSGTVKSKYQPPGTTNLEGLLFPDTYLVTDKEDETGIVRRLVERFDTVADDVGLGAAARPTGLGPYQLIVAASLVESEAKVKDDRPLIASVISNRLQKGMKLQIDATVLYAIGHKEKVLYKDLEVDSPYNTYKIDGLPPTPISAAGAEVAGSDAPPGRHDLHLLRALRQERQARLRHHGVGIRGPQSGSAPQRPDMSAGRPPLSGHTRVVGVIGDPVVHSLSPTLHNAAFEALGLDWVYVAFPVPRGRGADAVAAVPALGLAGLNVTMPHKEDVAGRLRRAHARRRRPPVGQHRGGAGPTAARWATPPTARASSTRWPTKASGVGGQPVLVLGAGGAARAVVLALGRAGAAVTVAARRPDAAEAAAALAPGAGAVPIGAVDPSAFAVVVNATPLGMSGGDPLPVDPESLHAGQAVIDLVYHPADTPLLTAARAQGATAVNGLGMLLHQAARSFTLWTGEPAPLDAMRDAVTAALATR